MKEMKVEIERLKRMRPAYAPILDFYEKVSAEQESARERVNVEPAKWDERLSRVRIKEGFSVVSAGDIPVDLSTAVPLFRKLCALGKEATSLMKNDVLKLEAAVESGTVTVEELLRRHSDDSFQIDTAGSLNIEPGVLKFLVYEAILPSIEANTAAIKEKIDRRELLGGHCPVCGSMPLISELRGEGTRSLLCSFCCFEWNTERMKCPFCGNGDHETLHYIYDETDEGHRVDLCDNCHGYIKTVDTRKMGYEPDLRLEEIVTAHYDMIAIQRGYKR